MGSEEEKERSTPRLPLFSVAATAMQSLSPERSGTVTPPLHTSAAVPFRWEQEPGKPIPCSALVPFSNPIAIDDFLPKCLELPPRLLVPSPTTVLEGPYAGGSSRFRSPSFRMSNDCYGSFGAERGLLGAMVLGSKGDGVKNTKGWWWFGSWRKRKKAFKVKREVTGGSLVFPSSAHSKESMSKITSVGSFTDLSHGNSRLWKTICGGLKQVVPWRSKKLKKDGSAL